MTARRRAEVRRVREEGRQAFLAGKHRETNPYSPISTDRHQWWVGYDDAEEKQHESLANEK